MINSSNYENKKQLGIPFFAVPNTFKHFTDPGHGWYKVSREILRKMDLLDKISSFSYQKGDWVYLEEDCDATIFFDRYKELFGEISNQNYFEYRRQYEFYKILRYLWKIL